MAMAGSGEKMVNVGMTTLYTVTWCMKFLSFCFSDQFQLSDPGAGPLYDLISFCWACANREINSRKTNNFFMCGIYDDTKVMIKAGGFAID
jgi:hypothetical protein